LGKDLFDYALGPGEIDGLNRIRARHPACRILMSSAFDAAPPPWRSRCARARAGSSASSRTRRTDRRDPRVAHGHLYPRADLAPQVGAAAPGGRPSPASRDDPDAPAPDRRAHAGWHDVNLSPREHEVLRCCLAGMSVTDIALKFSRSPKTISSQKQAAFRKPGITRDLELFSVRHLLGNE
jgi:DNA-binding NarL/FixJ family response regulator